MEACGEHSVTTCGISQLPMPSASIWTVELPYQYRLDSPLEKEMGLYGMARSAAIRKAHT